jgi:hypothetical protein
MTNLEAKFVLSAYRASGSDACDPAMQEALQQAQRDPALGAWLEQEQAHAMAVAARLAEVPLPAELPASFDRLRALVCRNLKFEGRDVSLVCFDSGGKKSHVFVARRDDFPWRGPGAIAPFFDVGRRLVAAGWSDAKNHYVMFSDASVEDVKRLL